MRICESGYSWLRDSSGIKWEAFDAKAWNYTNFLHVLFQIEIYNAYVNIYIDLHVSLHNFICIFYTYENIDRFK